MNIVVAKNAVIFSLILGAVIGIVSLLPMLTWLGLLTLSFFASIIVILYMKKGEKYLGIITNEQGAILGALIGCFTTVGFFASFAPMVCIIHLIFKNYYSYAIPDMFEMGAWLFFVILFMLGAILAMTNSVMGMGLSWLLSYIEKKPKDYDARLDIKIED